MEPSTNGETAVAERDEKTGRFLLGNPGGNGSPHAARAAAWREEFRLAVTPARMRTVIEKLLTAGEAGEPWAIHELLEKCYGKGPIYGPEEGQRQVMAVAVQVQIDLGAVLARALAAVVHEPLVPGLPSPFDLAKE